MRDHEKHTSNMVSIIPQWALWLVNYSTEGIAHTEHNFLSDLIARWGYHPHTHNVIRTSRLKPMYQRSLTDRNSLMKLRNRQKQRREPIGSYSTNMMWLVNAEKRQISVGWNALGNLRLAEASIHAISSLLLAGFDEQWWLHRRMSDKAQFSPSITGSISELSIK